MKVSKRFWLFLVIGAFVIAFASLSANYSQQGQEKNQLNQELSLAQLRLGQYSLEELSSQQAELEAQLTEVESQLEIIKTALYWPMSNGSIKVTDTIFEAADTCMVEIVEISSAGLIKETLEDVTRHVLSLNVKAEGSVAKLINFTSELSNSFPTGVAKSVQINIPEATDGGGEELEKPSADIALIIYFYQGD